MGILCGFLWYGNDICMIGCLLDSYGVFSCDIPIGFVWDFYVVSVGNLSDFDDTSLGCL